MTRTRAVSIGLLVVGAVGIVVSVVLLTRNGEESTSPRLVIANRPASASFAGLTETNVAVGGRCLRVVVADDQTERVQGLRQRRDLGPYDGMLFVFDAPSEVPFTMSRVPVELDIGFYSGSGVPVSRRRMMPCPRADADCPSYRAGGPFTEALETLAGQLPSGALSGCE